MQEKENRQNKHMEQQKLSISHLPLPSISNDLLDHKSQSSILSSATGLIEETDFNLNFDQSSLSEQNQANDLIWKQNYYFNG